MIAKIEHLLPVRISVVTGCYKYTNDFDRQKMFNFCNQFVLRSKIYSWPQGRGAPSDRNCVE